MPPECVCPAVGCPSLLPGLQAPAFPPANSREVGCSCILKRADFSPLHCTAMVYMQSSPMGGYKLP